MGRDRGEELKRAARMQVGNRRYQEARLRPPGIYQANGTSGEKGTAKRTAEVPLSWRRSWL
jgi:hypothetical protein